MFAPGSPQGLWIARVKKAGAADFPILLEEWETLFPEGESGLEGRPENALCWLLATWLVTDTAGYLTEVTRPDYRYAHWAAQVLVRLMPEKAAQLLGGPARASLHWIFALDAVTELAERNPAIYLKMNPDGTIDFTPGISWGDGDWYTAIASLAKTDAVAAANACLRWKVKNDPRTISHALAAVAEAWKPGDPPITQWVNCITDPKLRNFANHARLCAMAEQDPKAALAELYTAKLEHDSDLERDAPSEILKQLAKADPVAALKLTKDLEGIFSKYEWDPFAGPSAEDLAEMGTTPFGQLGRRYDSDGVENNGVRLLVLRAAAEKLPDDPTQLFGALHQLSEAMGGGDSTWQRGVEVALIRLKSEHWSGDTCVAAAGLWASEMNGAQDDLTFKQLAARAAHVNPEQTSAALDQLPEAARATFAGEIIKQLPASEPEQRIALLGYLTAEQWDDEFGKSLGGKAEDYAEAIAALPVATTVGAQQCFMEQWGEQDPEAAAQWLESLPDYAASPPAVKGLASAWASYDESAASAWVETLPAGPVRDGAAAGLANSISRCQPEEAWHWAASIADPRMRLDALSNINFHWGSKVPDDFRADLTESMRAAGFEVEEDPVDPPGPEDPLDPFR